MWSCGAELCCSRDIRSLARQGDSRLAQRHRASPLLHPSFPARTLEAFQACLNSSRRSAIHLSDPSAPFYNTRAAKPRPGWKD